MPTITADAAINASVAPKVLAAFVHAPTKLMKELGFGEGQKWEAGFHLDKSYLPEDARGQQIFGAKIDYNHNNKS